METGFGGKYSGNLEIFEQRRDKQQFYFLRNNEYWDLHDLLQYLFFYNFAISTHS